MRLDVTDDIKQRLCQRLHMCTLSGTTSQYSLISVRRWHSCRDLILAVMIVDIEVEADNLYTTFVRLRRAIHIKLSIPDKLLSLN